ncbi:MAG: hypothetical protein C0620_11510 [Desulfuromonas sp.]|nr:MAG: hypothetical protein C0620_11510 [Desulfuromonas sp.]
MSSIDKLFKQTPHPAEVSDYWHVFDLSNCLNVFYWAKYFEMAEQAPAGCIIECGVGRGRSLISLLALEALFSAMNSRPYRQVYALDSFEGFPEPHQVFDQSPRNPQKGQWGSSPNNQFSYSVDNLVTILRNSHVYDVAKEQLEIVKGFFSETIPTLNVGAISILHLDGDLYESVKCPLDALWEKVVLGGVIVIDDFVLVDEHEKDEPFPGARKAVLDFMENNECFEIKGSVRGTPYLVRVR